VSLLVVRAYLKLIRFDSYVSRGEFGTLHKRVRSQKIGTKLPLPDVVDRVCSAVDVACIWYWKEVFCLQRSAATACLLKSHGVPAKMIIGVQQIPIKAHAWVEVDGRVVNDKPYVSAMYTILDRC
jgi:hypothetical protein